MVASCGISCCKNVKSNFVIFVEFVFSVLNVVCYLGLLLGLSNVGILFSHINEDVRSKSHQIVLSV